MFTPGGTIHAVMTISAKVRHFLEELGKGCGVPHETPRRVFNSVQDSKSMTKSAQILGNLIKLICGCNFGGIKRT
jgi:hypothetical protein